MLADTTHVCTTTAAAGTTTAAAGTTTAASGTTTAASGTTTAAAGTTAKDEEVVKGSATQMFTAFSALVVCAVLAF